MNQRSPHKGNQALIDHVFVNVFHTEFRFTIQMFIKAMRAQTHVVKT